MAGDDDLELNTLHRFAKHSPRLVLEEYSHCEVPAGCGGVVLRWRDPSEGVPLQLVVAADGDLQVLVDGRFVSPTLSLQPGTHSIAVALTGATSPAIALALRLAGPGQYLRPGALVWATGASTRIRHAHEEGWAQPRFDDTRWRPATPAVGVDLGKREWRFRQVENMGAMLVATGGPTLWLRDTFEVPG
ncbi:MAG: hypothetical protein H6737_03540 [Alphaproteobacteria bacterium]|nr:hypothetical protein [Alphaproteobacteria bacterium]